MVAQMSADAWTRLNNRIGMPPVYVIRYTDSGSVKMQEALRNLVLHGSTNVPKFEADDMVVERRVGFREWSSRIRETYGC